MKARCIQNLGKVLGEKKLTMLKPGVSLLSNNNEAEGSSKETTNNQFTQNSNNNSTWYYVSDSSVSEVSESKILKAQAYILFYERIVSI